MKPREVAKVDERIASLRDAYEAASLLSYAQGFALLSEASKQYKYDIHLDRVAKIWRGGCIIRAASLGAMAEAFRANPSLLHLMADETLGGRIAARLPALRETVRWAIGEELPVPAFMAALAYADSLRAPHLPLNLVQAQRDAFGAHGFERIDEPGTFHAHWE
jgi:6-phosphogluconate dehydrogenase